MEWLFEIGAGVCDILTGCLICLPGCCSPSDFVLAIGVTNRTRRMREMALYSSPSFWAVTRMTVSDVVLSREKRSCWSLTRQRRTRRRRIIGMSYWNSWMLVMIDCGGGCTRLYYEWFDWYLHDDLRTSLQWEVYYVSCRHQLLPSFLSECCKL